MKNEDELAQASVLNEYLKDFSYKGKREVEEKFTFIHASSADLASFAYKGK